MKTDLFLDALDRETARLYDLNGSMSTVYYHQHYLAQEAYRKIELYKEGRYKNKERAVRFLIGAASSTLGQYNKMVGYEGKTDLNLDYCHYLKEEAVLQKKNQTILGIDDAQTALWQYNELAGEDKRRAVKALITAGVAIMKVYLKEMGHD